MVSSDCSTVVASLPAADVTRTQIAAAEAAVSPHFHPRAALTVATISPDSLPKDTAVVAYVCNDSPRVPAREADVFAHSSQGDPEAVITFFTFSFPVVGETESLFFGNSSPGMGAAMIVSAVYLPRMMVGTAAAVFIYYSPRVVVAAAAVGGNPCL